MAKRSINGNETLAQLCKGIFPAPIYQAHFTDGTHIRMSFWSHKDKPMDVDRGMRLCMVTKHAKNRRFSHGLIDIGDELRPVESFPQITPRKPPIRAARVREIVKAMTAEAISDNDLTIIPTSSYRDLVALTT